MSRPDLIHHLQYYIESKLLEILCAFWKKHIMSSSNGLSSWQSSNIANRRPLHICNIFIYFEHLYQHNNDFEISSLYCVIWQICHLINFWSFHVYGWIFSNIYRFSYSNWSIIKPFLRTMFLLVPMNFHHRPSPDFGLRRFVTAFLLRIIFGA